MAAPENYTKVLQESQDVFHRFPLHLVHGIPLMEPIAQQWGPIENFQARPDDLLISTYPKAGTTWMQEIVDLILVQGDVEKACRAPTHIRIPFLEICSPPLVPSGVQQLANVPSPRVIKTHLPFQLVPKSFWENRCKARDPNPVPNSSKFFFYLILSLGRHNVKSYENYQRFIYTTRPKGPLILLPHQDPAREIRRVMDFLEVELPPQVLEKIVQQTSFQIMKENPMANYSSIPSTILDQTVSPFMRKGQVGDWKNHFTVAQSEAFDAHYQRRMEGTGLHFRTQI
uniref:Sulfotransferase n=1 Tax=Chrysemys picta bellii TaxID=8478 RepID=A0A8C3FWA6_CHRPI